MNKRAFFGLLAWIIIIIVVLAVIIGGSFYLNLKKGDNLEIGAGKVKFNIDINRSDNSQDNQGTRIAEENVSVLDRFPNNETENQNNTENNSFNASNKITVTG